jgi:hypothetical protein
MALGVGQQLVRIRYNPKMGEEGRPGGSVGRRNTRLTMGISICKTAIINKYNSKSRPPSFPPFVRDVSGHQIPIAQWGAIESHLTFNSRQNSLHIVSSRDVSFGEYSTGVRIWQTCRPYPPMTVEAPADLQPCSSDPCATTSHTEYPHRNSNQLKRDSHLESSLLSTTKEK